VRRFLGEDYLGLALLIHTLAELRDQLPQRIAAPGDRAFSAGQSVSTVVNELFKEENGRGHFTSEDQTFTFGVADLLAALTRPSLS
jgi:hypothetical protein